MSVADIKVELAAMRAQALAVWHRLTMAQKSALRRALVENGQPRLHHTTHKRVADCMARQGRELVERRESAVTRTPYYPLTPSGLLVREVGLAHESAEAKRSYRRRRAS